MDQRGLPRRQGNHVDIGAYESDFRYFPPLIQSFGTNTHTRTNFVPTGKLQVDGIQPQSRVHVNGGIVSGMGTVGHVHYAGASGWIAPGASPGILTCSNFSAGALGAGTLSMELNGTTPGSGHDQINVRGTVNLTGLPIDAKLHIGDEQFQINYAGGDGNDVVLTRLLRPPRPVLTIELVLTNSVRLLWATNDPAYQLQSNTNLNASTWFAVTPLPSVIATNSVVTNAIGGDRRFYRLVKP